MARPHRLRITLGEGSRERAESSFQSSLKKYPMPSPSPSNPTLQPSSTRQLQKRPNLENHIHHRSNFTPIKSTMNKIAEPKPLTEPEKRNDSSAVDGIRSGTLKRTDAIHRRKGCPVGVPSSHGARMNDSRTHSMTTPGAARLSFPYGGEDNGTNIRRFDCTEKPAVLTIRRKPVPQVKPAGELKPASKANSGVASNSRTVSSNTNTLDSRDRREKESQVMQRTEPDPSPGSSAHFQGQVFAFPARTPVSPNDGEEPFAYPHSYIQASKETDATRSSASRENQTEELLKEASTLHNSVHDDDGHGEMSREPFTTDLKQSQTDSNEPTVGNQIPQFSRDNSPETPDASPIRRENPEVGDPKLRRVEARRPPAVPKEGKATILAQSAPVENVNEETVGKFDRQRMEEDRSTQLGSDEPQTTGDEPEESAKNEPKKFSEARSWHLSQQPMSISRMPGTWPTSDSYSQDGKERGSRSDQERNSCIIILLFIWVISSFCK